MNKQWFEFLRKNQAYKHLKVDVGSRDPSEWWRSTRHGECMIWVMHASGLRIDPAVWGKIISHCGWPLEAAVTPRVAMAAASRARSSAISPEAKDAVVARLADYIRTLIPDLDWSFLGAT